MQGKSITTLLWLTLAVTLVTGGCATPPEQDVTRGAQQMYEEAREALETANWPEAIDRLNALEARYPFGPWARRAQLDLIHSHHQQHEWEAGLAIAERFLTENPGHSDSAWVQYMKGLLHFDRTVGLLERSRWRADRSPMDPRHARQSFQEFSLVVRRYPDSEYAADARQRMIYLHNRLARHEYHVADYYYRRGAYVAAANRAAELVSRYQGAPIVPDALRLLEAAYRELDMNELAMDTRQVYKASFGGRDQTPPRD